MTGYETLDAALRDHPGALVVALNRGLTGATMRVSIPGVPRPIDILGVPVIGPSRGELLRALASAYDDLDGA